MSNHDRDSPRPPNRDAALVRAWQQASAEQPPAQLDAAIVAAARKSVQDHDQHARVTRTSSRSRVRPTWWQPLAAAATVAGLAFILVQSLPRDRDVAPPIRMEEPSPGPAPTQEKAHSPSAREATDAKASSEVGTAGDQAPVAATDRDSTDVAVPPPDTTAPTATVPQATAEATDSAATADGTTAYRATEADQRKAEVSEMAGRAASTAAAAPAQASSLGNTAPPSAADWASSIATLYAAGDVAGAADTLRAFRTVERNADMYLPESLRVWARTVE
jgi:hypothetical protein